MINIAFVLLLLCIGTTLLGTTTEDINVSRKGISPEWNETTFQVEVVRNIRERPYYHFLEIGIIESPKMVLYREDNLTWKECMVNTYTYEDYMYVVDMINGIDMDAVFPQRRNNTDGAAKTSLFQFYSEQLTEAALDSLLSNEIRDGLLYKAAVNILQSAGIQSFLYKAAMTTFNKVSTKDIVVFCANNFSKLLHFISEKFGLKGLAVLLITSSMGVLFVYRGIKSMFRMARYVQYVCIRIALLVTTMKLIGLLTQQPAILAVGIGSIVGYVLLQKTMQYVRRILVNVKLFVQRLRTNVIGVAWAFFVPFIGIIIGLLGYQELAISTCSSWLCYRAMKWVARWVFGCFYQFVLIVVPFVLLGIAYAFSLQFSSEE